MLWSESCSGQNHVVVAIMLWSESCCGWNHVVVGIMLWSDSRCGQNHVVVTIQLNYQVGFKTKTSEFFFTDFKVVEPFYQKFPFKLCHLV